MPSRKPPDQFKTIPSVLVGKKLRFRGVSKKLHELMNSKEYANSIRTFCTYFDIINGSWLVVHVSEDFCKWYDWFEPLAAPADLHRIHSALIAEMEEEKKAFDAWLAFSKYASKLYAKAAKQQAE